mmetsp:Transcript_8428/g.12556  ORF Transcript_8428/g.12556 Transcript_8428/m.12556 type:complete len:116 (-) Transcript_8428:35-382(-)
MLVREVVYSNALFPMYKIDVGMKIVVSKGQIEKVPQSIEVTEVEINMDTREWQSWNTQDLIEYTEVGMEMEVMALSLKAPSEITLTEVGMTMVFSEVQPKKEYIPIEVTVVGIVI